MDILTLFGRIHPVLVHLPIGIILLGLLLFWRERLGRKTGGDQLAFIFLLGAVSASLSAISGYTLSLEGDHDASLVDSHRNAGLLMTAMSWAMWWMVRIAWQLRLQNILSVALFVMVLITGHEGGSLTHGEGFLFPSAAVPTTKIKPLADINQAVLYTDVVNPILQDKCVSCHGPTKQKGKLKLDTYEHIFKGGKNGAVVNAGSKEKSELLKRIMLPPDDEDHMPPKEKGQLTDDQIVLIEWWIMKGADASVKVSALDPDDAIRHALAQYAKNGNDEVTVAAPALPEVKPADGSVIEALRKQGVVIVPVAQGSNLLHVNLVNCTSISDSVKQNLSRIRDQLYSLKAEGPMVNDSLVMSLGSCTQLRRLSLANANISEASFKTLTSIPSLRYLNLYGTALAGKLEKKDLRVYPQRADSSFKVDKLVQ